ncbi:phosphotransferase [Roseicyclus sp. F158]|uniref:Phosphotransferase n=1 Tax=Tropicimonas omnivorans TaxID=3075590 RepID=A0ABU3DD53_9RHOB|nr:phosphotransferase [Roseicyclus sp. F158]MDT0681464.1 phosphotransferase [Roseicyclus sp. F158]
MSRPDAARDFIAAAGWGAAENAPLAGDASNRSYRRLTAADGSTAVLMDAPPETGEDVRPFLAIARHLTALGLSAPAILKADEDAGFLLLEDLGDELFTRVVEAHPDKEEELYAAAVDLLAGLHRHPAPDSLQAYDAPRLAELAALPWHWYRIGCGEDAADASEFRQELEEIVRTLADDTSALALRDFHAANLVWLPDREGPARVGLLDFQDAMSAHPVYDLVSLLEDARRDVPEKIRTAMSERYMEKTGLEPDEFEAAAAILGAQRALRILGVFARLSLHYGKTQYIPLIPRVWDHLQRDLGHPALARIRELVLRDLPEPTAERLSRMEAQCGTIPSL